MRNVRSKKLRDSARDEECTLQLPGVCNGRTDTTVWCHSNRLSDGKGMGLKSSDDRGVYGCYACHGVLDGQVRRPPWLSTQDIDDHFDLAQERTRQRLIEKGLIP
jgi:hypothetical protein